MEGNCNLVLKLFCEPAPGMYTRDYQDDGFKDVRQAVLSGKVSTVIPIEIACLHDHTQVCEDLLLKTGMNAEEGSVNWHGLRLLDLNASWLRKIHWVKRLHLAQDGLMKLPNEMGTYFKQVCFCTIILIINSVPLRTGTCYIRDVFVLFMQDYCALQELLMRMNFTLAVAPPFVYPMTSLPATPTHSV